MIARKIKPEEVKRTEQLFSISFDISNDNEESPMELYNNYAANPQSREQEHCLERFAAFEDDDKTMMSSFITQPFEVNFDDHNVKMFGIGGVATLPQYRKRGGIRACFEASLPYMYEQGVAFSYLYPFSTAYYRKFGYEICCKRQLFRIGLPHIPVYPIKGACYLLEQSTIDMAKEDIPFIYRDWQKKYNMMVKDSHHDYNFITSANPFKDQIFTYVYRSENGQPLAYMTFKCNTTPGIRKIECSHFFYINEEGLQGLLTLARGFASDYREISFSLPADGALEQVMPEWSMGAVACELIPLGMVRVVNAAKVLQDARYIGDGKLILQITDPYIPQNNNTISVTFQDGKCTKLTNTTEQPDITLPISVFSTLITGGYDTTALSSWENVTIHHNTESISKVFYKKPVYIATYF